MFALYILAASFYVLAAQAIVYPFTPEPTNAGATCTVSWDKDNNATTLAAGTWKDMSIELMTGDNNNFVHITTVACQQDGTIKSQFEYTCPEVTINAPIYFYVFRSPHTTEATWTSRFTIKSATGESKDAPNATQPDGSLIPWGTGALKDPSQAVGPPDFGGTGSSSSVASSTTVAQAGATKSTSKSTSSPSVTATNKPDDDSDDATETSETVTKTGTDTATKTGTKTSTRMVKSSTGGASATATKSDSDGDGSTATVKPTNSNAATNAVALDLHLVQVGVLLVSCGMGFAILL